MGIGEVLGLERIKPLFNHSMHSVSLSALNSQELTA
jgi:hypothetical protein